MPFFQALQDIKGFTTNINPLNLFNSDEPIPQSAPAPAPASTSTNTSASGTPIATRPPNGAVAGPGPSSTATAARRAGQSSDTSSAPTTPAREALNPLGAPIRPTALRHASSPAPIRPSLKRSGTSTSSPGSSDSSDSAGRRKSSGVNVVIADPEVSTGGERRRTPGQRGARPISTASGMTNASGVEGESRSRRRRKPLDTYIIVKPPPTSSKNPLNLQIQLVVKPSRRGRDRSASAISSRSGSMVGEGPVASEPPSPSAQTVDLPADSSDTSDTPETGTARTKSPTPIPISPPGDKGLPGSPKSASTTSDAAGETGLKRSSSLRSSISTSTAATGSSAGSGKRIEPMFNLAVHNVMQPTVVTDAATDVKVAKFHKRTLDVAGVGTFEPAEVWQLGSHTPNQNLFSATSRVSDDDGSTSGRARPLSMVSLTAPLSPTLTRSDDGKAGIRASLDLKGFRFDSLRPGQNKSEGQESGAKKFFGKVFKKKTSMSDIGAGKPRKTSPSASFSSYDGQNGHAAAAALATNDGTIGGADTLHPNTAVGISRSLGVPPSNVVDLSATIVGNPTFGTAPLVVRRRSSGAIVTADGAVTGLTAHVDHLTLRAATGTEPVVGAEASELIPAAKGMERCQSLPIVPSNRPVGYTWTVRRWAKRNTEGWAAHIVAAANAGLELVGNGPDTEKDDGVVFEWVKLRVPANAAGDDILRRYSATGAISTARTRSKSRAASIAPDSAGSADNQANYSHTSLTLQPPPRRSASPFPPSPNPNLSSPHASPLGSPRLDGRPEPVRKVSSSMSPSRRTSSTTLDHDANSVHATATGDYILNDDEDSDPEDSETPWTCSVWVKKTGQRQLLGTLTPAPHHPKVIAILKIPMDLDAVSLTDVRDVQPTTTNGGDRELAAKKVKEGIALTEENLKDVVCVTAMWLVAREKFNGLGMKQSRRGAAA